MLVQTQFCVIFQAHAIFQKWFILYWRVLLAGLSLIIMCFGFVYSVESDPWG